MFALIIECILSLWGAYVFLPFLAVSFQLAMQEKVWCLRSKNSRMPLAIRLDIMFL
jgi:hypothetical protein